MPPRRRTQPRAQSAQQNQQNQTPQQGQAAQQNTAQGGGRPTRLITGPQSALTDYLASHNISANQIRRDAEQRRAAAAQSLQARGDDGDGDEDDEEAGPSTAPADRGGRNETAAEKSKRKLKEQQAIAKIKASKAFKKRKRHAEDLEDDDDIALALMQEMSKPLPGQMDNCEICKKRFTVTPYSLNGPNGGLLCAKCSKEIADKKGKNANKPRKPVGGNAKRRKVQSNILDGTYHTGAKKLTTLCIETLAKNVDLADSLGELPDHIIDKIARLFSKRRLLKPETLPLFVQPLTSTVRIYDGAKLLSDDFISIFQVATQLEEFKVRNAIQFKDKVMEYLLSRDAQLSYFYLHGANLLSDDAWTKFIMQKGAALNTLQVYYTDKHFGDEMLGLLPKHCPNLNRLKVYHNQKVTNEGIKEIGKIKTLKHLGLHLDNQLNPKVLASTILSAGKYMETLSLRKMPEANDEVLNAIKTSCRSLKKLRITDSEAMTDEGFVDLFTNWANPPIETIDLQKCVHRESTQPRHNPLGIGLCDNGFRALMKHSGRKIRNLNIHACRHIHRAAFEEVFSEDNVYTDLVKLEVSFVEEVDDFVLGCIFRSCPNIREVNVFGCMKVRDVPVPRGKVLVGVPNAMGMVVEGKDD
ncbi:DNA repair protein rhp7 [Colletotrichum chlorophyti]|uniref:DNA repair protein rhp7 n=1 Tax=Colletotrichum chlorophyti TaxID=708187 RepID=A0A1Q8RS13_9PEZI|nr:DNA repair protein rhp7 [Colletotrichum chlorophyti]